MKLQGEIEFKHAGEIDAGFNQWSEVALRDLAQQDPAELRYDEHDQVLYIRTPSLQARVRAVREGSKE